MRFSVSTTNEYPQIEREIEFFIRVEALSGENGTTTSPLENATLIAQFINSTTDEMDGDARAEHDTSRPGHYRLRYTFQYPGSYEVKVLQILQGSLSEKVTLPLAFQVGVVPPTPKPQETESSSPHNSSHSH